MDLPPPLEIRDAAYVVAGPPPYEVLTGASVRVAGGRVVGVGDAASAGGAAGEAVVVDGRGCAVLPGFVNGHTHATFALDGGVAPESSLDGWLPTVFAVGGAIGPEESMASARHAFAEMLANGYTTCLDHHYAQAHPENALAVVEAAVEVGLRVVLAPTAYDLGEGAVDLDEGRRGLTEVLRRCGRDDASRVVPWLGLSSPLRRESVARCRDLVAFAREHRLGLTYHYAETRGWFDLVRSAGFARLTEALEALQLLGGDVVVAHGVWFDDHDADVLAATGTTISHNPVSNGFLGDGIAPVVALRRAGVNVCLGADSRNCTGRSDPFEAMRTAAALARASSADGSLLPVRELLAMATAAGARAVHGPAEPAAGTIAEGAPADLVVVDMERLHLQPVHDPIWSLVWGATGADVRSVVVAGELVVDDGQPLRVDVAEVLDASRRAGDRLRRAVDAPPSSARGEACSPRGRP